MQIKKWMREWMRAGVLTLAAGAAPLTPAAPEATALPMPPTRSASLPERGLDCLPLAPAVTAAIALPALPLAVFSPDRTSLFADALGERALDGYRGGTDLVSNDARLSGLVGENAATNVSTGANTIDGAAFANVSGIPVVIQNSGANVLIQNSTIVNLQLK